MRLILFTAALIMAGACASKPEDEVKETVILKHWQSIKADLESFAGKPVCLEPAGSELSGFLKSSPSGHQVKLVETEIDLRIHPLYRRKKITVREYGTEGSQFYLVCIKGNSVLFQKILVPANEKNYYRHDSQYRITSGAAK